MIMFNSVIPYHVYVPSFGDWGFVMASKFIMDKELIDIKIPIINDCLLFPNRMKHEYF